MPKSSRKYLQGEMTDRERTRIRKLQDKLLKLLGPLADTYPNLGICDHAGAPTISQLRSMIWPDWEAHVTAAIQERKHQLGRSA